MFNLLHTCLVVVEVTCKLLNLCTPMVAVETPQCAVGSDYRFEVNRDRELAAAVDMATPALKRANDKLVEAGKIALQLHATPLIVRGRELYRLCRHGLITAIASMARPLPSSVLYIMRFVEESRATFRELVGDAVAGARIPCHCTIFSTIRVLYVAATRWLFPRSMCCLWRQSSGVMGGRGGLCVMCDCSW